MFLKKNSSFLTIAFAHLTTTLNINFYKVLLILFLFKTTSIKEAVILSSATFVFVLPFIIFAAFFGSIADKYSKKRVIYISKFLEILFFILGSFAFMLTSPIVGFCSIFLLGVSTACFGPAKYGVLPEVLPINNLSKFNGVMNSITYVCSVGGLFLASAVASLWEGGIASPQIIASIASLFIILFSATSTFFIKNITPVEAQNAQKSIEWKFWSDVIATVRSACNIRYLVPSLFLGSFFFFIGTFLQLNILPFVEGGLKLNSSQGGFLFLVAAFGIGIGSILIGRLSKRGIELGAIPLCGVILGLAMVAMFIFQNRLGPIIISLFVLGLFGGGFVVPANAFVQAYSPSADRGRNLASSGFLDFCGLLTASASLFLFGVIFGFKPATSILTIGLVCVLISCWLLFSWVDLVIRMLLNAILSMRYAFIYKEELIDGTLFIAPAYDRRALFLLLALLPRTISARCVGVSNNKLRSVLSLGFIKNYGSIEELYLLNMQPSLKKTLIFTKKADFDAFVGVVKSYKEDAHGIFVIKLLEMQHNKAWIEISNC